MRKRTILMAILAVAAMNLLTSCEKIKGKGDVISESRTVGTYHSIELAISATVHFTESDHYSLVIHAQENILHAIVTEVDGDQLVIRQKNGVILGAHDAITVYISAPAVTRLDVSGSGDIYAGSTWKPAQGSGNISGSGGLYINEVLADSFTAKISGSGTIKANSGTVKQLNLSISGSGTIDLRQVQAENVITTTSGSGDTYVYANQLLDVSISGSGDIWYQGQPAINAHISGSGNLRKL